MKDNFLYSKSPSSCKLSKMWTCIWFQQGTRIYSINVNCEWNGSCPSISYCWWFFSSTISYLLSAPPLLSCSLNPSPYMPALLYSTIVLFKIFWYKIKNIFFIFLCIVSVKRIINLLQYSPIWQIVLAGYLG